MLMNKALTLGFITIAIAAGVIGMTQVPQTTMASRSAFDEGYDNGRSDFLDSNDKVSYCDPDNTASNPDAYCALYKAGYEVGWAAARGLYGDQ
jgi:hypothetical protein